MSRAHDPSRFWRFLKAEGTHLIWTGPVNPDNGIPIYHVPSAKKAMWKGSSHVQVRREIFNQVGRPVPKELRVLPDCQEQLCVLPAHMRLVTHKEMYRSRRGTTVGEQPPGITGTQYLNDESE